jgi:hypothetical protein
MRSSARRSLALASLVALVLVASGLEVRCDGADAQSRTTIASLQAEMDLLGLRVAMLEASASGYRLKGFSSTNVSGNGGVLQMNAACANSFPNGRMCTSSEVLQTSPAPAITSNADAWVRPSYEPVATGSGAASVALDQSGVPAPNSSNGNSAEDLTCRGWAASGATGLAVDKNGRFRLLGCDNGRPVACCAP